MEKTVKIFLLVYVATLFLFAFTIIPNNDSYYYWELSRNLQLSYFTGPPMIVYIIKLATLIFTNSVFAINVVGSIVAMITTYIIAAIINLLFSMEGDDNLGQGQVNKSLGLIVGLLWLTYPFVTTRYILVDVTYDCLVNLFDLGTLLFALRYIKYRNPANIYYIGFFAGFGLLSKYSSIIMLVTLISYFIYNRELRGVFKGRHIYLSMLICLGIFMPVLIWNYQHNFSSFLFQLKYHSWLEQAKVSNANNRHLFGRIWYYLGTGVFGPMIVYWLMAVYLIIKNKSIGVKSPPSYNKYWQEKSLATNLILTQIIVIGIFWFLICPFAMVDLIYLLTFNSLMIIFIGYHLLYQRCYQLVLLIIVLGTILSIINMLHYSLVPACPTCYSKYIISKQLEFNSPLMKYIK